MFGVLASALVSISLHMHRAKLSNASRSWLLGAENRIKVPEIESCMGDIRVPGQPDPTNR